MGVSMGRSVKETARRQYERIIIQAAEQARGLEKPPEGWIVSMRKALAMSGAQLARRAGVSRAAIHQAERNERDGVITLKQLDKLTKAMGGRLVYAIVPEMDVATIADNHARVKAASLVRRAGVQMALKDQSLDSARTEDEIDQVAADLITERPSDFWDDE